MVVQPKILNFSNECCNNKWKYAQQWHERSFKFLPGVSESEVASGGCNQGTTKKTSLNACQENNVKVLGEEECEDLFENSMENIIFNEFSYK